MTGGWNPTLPPPTSSCYHFHNSGKNSFFCPPALSDPETQDPAQPFLFQAKELLKNMIFSPLERYEADFNLSGRNIFDLVKGQIYYFFSVSQLRI